MAKPKAPITSLKKVHIIEARDPWVTQKYSFPSIFLTLGIPQNSTWHICRASKNACITNLQI